MVNPRLIVTTHKNGATLSPNLGKRKRNILFQLEKKSKRLKHFPHY